MPNKPLQPFNDDFNKHRADALAAAKRLTGVSGKLNAAQVQALYNSAIGKETDNERRLAVGYAFGELMIERGGFKWMIAFDELASEPVVAGDAGVFCAPLHMLARRLEVGEAANIDKLCSDTIATMRDVTKGGGR